jgi:hypothetical protein
MKKPLALFSARRHRDVGRVAQRRQLAREVGGGEAFPARLRRGEPVLVTVAVRTEADEQLPVDVEARRIPSARRGYEGKAAAS